MHLPSTVTKDEDANGLTRYLVDSPTCQATVYELGATVTSWRPSGADDVLWVSAESDFQVGKGIRGGIPICAPWFGAGRGVDEVPQAHGFVRFAKWRLTEATQDEETRLTFEIGGAELATLPGAHLYPADLHFRYTLGFGDALSAALEVTSKTQDFVLDEALHTYFSVSDVRNTVVKGLDGVDYLDKVPGGRDQTQVGDVTFTAETDRVFQSEATCVIVDERRAIEIVKEGSGSTIVWNPWIDRAAAMSAFGDDEWTEMVCVEVGNALNRAKHVPAGTSSRVGMRISLIPGPQTDTPIDAQRASGFTL